MGGEASGARASDPLLARRLPTLDLFLSHVPVPDGRTCVFASGSAVTGLSHATSDLDFFVVTETPPAVRPTSVRHDIDVAPPTVPILVLDVGDVRWDVEFWLVTQIEQLLARCRVGDLDEQYREPFSVPEVELLVKLSEAIPLEGAGWLDDAQSRLRRSRLRPVLIERALYGADALLDDTAGLLDSGDLFTAVLTAHDAFGRVVDALLNQAGQLSIGPKWRARRFQRARPEALGWDEYWARTTMRGYDPDRPEPWIRDMLDRCRELILQVDVS